MNAATAAPAPAATRPLAPLLTLLQGTRQSADAVRLLRQALPRLRVQALDAADLAGETPAARDEHWSLYLAASDGHCWRMTTEAAEAAAVFVVPVPAASGGGGRA